MSNIVMLEAALKQMNEARSCITQKHAEITRLQELAQDANKKRTLAARLSSLGTADKMLTDANGMWKEAVNATGDDDTLAANRLAAAINMYNDVMTVLHPNDTPTPQPAKVEEEAAHKAEAPVQPASDPVPTTVLSKQSSDKPKHASAPDSLPEPPKAKREAVKPAEPVVSTDALKGLEERLTAALTDTCKQGLAGLREEIAASSLSGGHAGVLEEFTPEDIRRALRGGLRVDTVVEKWRMPIPRRRTRRTASHQR